MRSILVGIVVFVFCTHWSNAQKLYKGETTFERILIYSIEGNNIYKGDKTWNNPIYSFDSRFFYSGSSQFQDQRLFSFEGNFVYLISQGFNNTVIYTVTDNKIYSGDSTFSSDCLFTLKDGKIYRGDSSFVSDILFTLESNENVDLRVIACLIGPY